MNKVLFLIIPALFLTGCLNQFGEDMIPRSEADAMVEAVKQQAIVDITKITNECVESLDNARTLARDAKRLSDIKGLQIAAELYFIDNGAYPLINVNVAVKSTDSNWPILLRTMYSTNPEIQVRDPEHPDKYYQYISDGEKITITSVLENENYGCEPIGEGLCKFEAVSDSTL